MSTDLLPTITRRGAGVAGRWQLVDTDTGRAFEYSGGGVVAMPWLGAPALQEHLPDAVGPGAVAVIGEEPSHYVIEVAATATTATLRDVTGGEYALRHFEPATGYITGPEALFVAGGDVPLQVPGSGGGFLFLTRSSL